jgi:diguanylate cyclase (GGDEF)-like protein
MRVQPSALLAQVIDEHLAWFAAWHRHAFIDRKKAKSMPVPDALALWHHEAMQSVPGGQPALENVRALHDQLHTLARLVLMKEPTDQPINIKDYDSVVAKYQEFMQGLRRLDRAFAAAAAGLDTLTGLRSRAGLIEDLTREHHRFLRTGHGFCVAMMDVDHFKKINDEHGHAAGDRVLMTVANHISRLMRPFDDAYRVGGEEFLICIKETDPDGALAVLERLRSALEKLPIPLPNDHRVRVTASFGFVLSAKGIDAEAMMKMADEALYKAKNEGRNCIVAAEA